MTDTLFEQLGGTYTQQGDYLLPNLALPAEKETGNIGVWALRHKRYIKQHHCVRRCKTTPRPSKSDTLTAEIRHPFRWSDSWYFRVETGLYVGPHAVWLSP